jgi:hypothetical protein
MISGHEQRKNHITRRIVSKLPMYAKIITIEDTPGNTHTTPALGQDVHEGW